MTLQIFISRLNWRLIIIHFLASWFFIHAFEVFSYLYNTNIIDTIRKSNDQDIIQVLKNNGSTSSDIINFLFWTRSSGFFGLLIAFIVSLAICIKRHWFWVNALVVLLLSYFVDWFDLLGWNYLNRFFLYFGKRFTVTTIEFIFNGTILLILGLLFFFLNKTNQFINKKSVTA